METNAALRLLRKLSHEVRDLDVGVGVQRLMGAPDPLTFHRSFVSRNKPVLIEGAIDHWRALTQWTDERLLALLGDSDVSVAITPNGRADAVTPLGGAAVGVTPRLCFCLPLEQRMPFSELLSHLQTRAAQQLPVAPALCTDATDGLAAAKHDAGEARAVNGSKRTDDAYLRGSDGGVAADRMRESRNGSHRCHGSGMAKAGAVRTGGSGEVWYVQQQNNSLMTEFAQLLPDVEPHLPWATEALGSAPEAGNLWIGTDASMTSFHRDHYENLYCVIRGTKIFSLLPPADGWRMHLCRYPVAQYQRHGSRLEPEPVDPPQQVLWCPVDADGPADRERFPHFWDPALPPPIRCEVHAGEVLYLPAGWYHQVSQRSEDGGAVISVNFWHDMAFDSRTAMTGLVHGLAEQLGLNEPA